MQVHLETFLAMNTRLSVLAPGADAVSGARLARRVRAVAAAQERRMSRFRADAELAGLNACAFERPVRVSATLWRILTACGEHWRRTRGAFDVAWQAAADVGQSGFSRVRLNPDERSVRFASPEVRLDLGGIGKGVALKAVETALRRMGMTSGLVSFGESSILALGAMPNGADWVIGLAEAGDLVNTGGSGLSLRDACLSTSGTGQGAAPTVDPRTGEVASPERLVSVVCRCPVEAEVVSTALLARPAERDWILQQYQPIRAIEFALDRRGGFLERRVAWSHG